jgi:MraZ protein
MQNRIRLTPSLCELAELQKEVVVVGQQDRMEIWDAGKWKEFNAGTAKNFKSVMADVFRNRQAGVK